MKFRIALICFFSFIYLNGYSQSDVIKIASDVLSAKVDRLGNVYYIDTKNTLNKYEPKINRITKYADLKNGKITSIDVSNPLRIVVFYEDQASVKFLDINLTEINSFQIRNNYVEGWISLVASSNNNGLWMYDNINRKLLKLGEQLNTQFSTGDLYLILSKKINPNAIVEFSDELFLCDSTNGIFVFDLFGGYKKSIPYTLENFERISSQNIVHKNTAILLNKSELFYFQKTDRQ